MDREESDRNGFHYFVKALEILSMEAEEQCKAEGSYNTPWEIQHDVADSVGLGSGLISTGP